MNFKRVVEHRAIVGPTLVNGPEDRFWLHQEGHPDGPIDPPFRKILMRVTYEEITGEVAQAPSAQWQPIETAPQMRKVLVFYRNALGKGRVVTACYYRDNALEMDDDYAEVGTYDEASGTSYAPAGWYEEHEGESPLMPLDEQPTHWMKLPEPPK